MMLVVFCSEPCVCGLLLRLRMYTHINEIKLMSYTLKFECLFSRWLVNVDIGSNSAEVGVVLHRAEKQWEVKNVPCANLAESRAPKRDDNETDYVYFSTDVRVLSGVCWKNGINASLVLTMK